MISAPKKSACHMLIGQSIIGYHWWLCLFNSIDFFRKLSLSLKFRIPSEAIKRRKIMRTAHGGEFWRFYFWAPVVTWSAKDLLIAVLRPRRKADDKYADCSGGEEIENTFQCNGSHQNHMQLVRDHESTPGCMPADNLKNKRFPFEDN